MTLKQAIRILKKGGLVAYPTETFYGLAADPTNDEALRRIFKAKGRRGGEPISIIISSLRQLPRWVLRLKARDKRLIKAFWPGPLTIVFKARKSVSRYLTGGGRTIGIRLPSDNRARKLAGMMGGAITATSANRSGKPAALTPLSVMHQLGGRLDGIVSGRRLARSKGSTILDISSIKPKVLREGEIPAEIIQNFFKELPFS